MDKLTEAFSNPSEEHLQVYIGTGLALLLGLLVLYKLLAKPKSDSQVVTMDGLMDGSEPSRSKPKALTEQKSPKRESYAEKSAKTSKDKKDKKSKKKEEAAEPKKGTIDMRELTNDLKELQDIKRTV